MKAVDYSVKDRIGYIALNRPERHNALDYDLLDDIDEAFDMAEADDNVNVIVLKGNGKSFSSGYDLKGSYYITGPKGGVTEWDYKNASTTLRGVEERYMRIWNCPKITVAQVHGYALAGGCYLQMICDISIAAEDAQLGHPAGRSGGVSSMPLWQVLLGPKMARYLLFTGRLIDGKEAERIGLVSLAVPAEELETFVDQVAAEAAAIPHIGATFGKDALNMDLEIMGLSALFRYHGQMNAVSRLLKK